MLFFLKRTLKLSRITGAPEITTCKESTADLRIPKVSTAFNTMTIRLSLACAITQLRFGIDTLCNATRYQLVN